MVTYDSEFIEASNLRKRKKKALTPINDSYMASAADYASPRESWQWYPRESTHGREKKPTPLHAAKHNKEEASNTKTRGISRDTQ